MIVVVSCNCCAWDIVTGMRRIWDIFRVTFVNLQGYSDLKLIELSATIISDN